MEEYKKIATKLYKKTSYHTHICCVDDESNKMVGFYSLNLYRRGDPYSDVMEAKTAEVQTFYKILHTWNKLCPVPDILTRYGVDQFFDDGGLASHRDYRGYSLTTEAEQLCNVVCKANSVPLAGAWMTSKTVQNATKDVSWDTIYEVSAGELEKILGVKFPNATQMFVYKIKKIV